MQLICTDSSHSFAEGWSTIPNTVGKQPSTSWLTLEEETFTYEHKFLDHTRFASDELTVVRNANLKFSRRNLPAKSLYFLWFSAISRDWQQIWKKTKFLKFSQSSCTSLPSSEIPISLKPPLNCRNQELCQKWLGIWLPTKFTATFDKWPWMPVSRFRTKNAMKTENISPLLSSKAVMMS